MPDLFDTHLSRAIIGNEGGYVNHPSDPGGETNWGITIGVARENGFTGPMRTMTRAQALAIYKAKYWIRPNFFQLANYSAVVAEEVFDTGVNMGTGTSSIFLQRVLNVLNRRGRDYPDINVDGGVGPATMRSVHALFAVRGRARAENVLMMGLNSLQGARYIELSENRSTNEDFTFGWLDKRVGFNNDD